MLVFISGSFGQISPASRGYSPQAQIADSNSINALSFSSARTTKRFPPSRCASATKIVRPPAFTAETQPQRQPALLRLLLTNCGAGLLVSSCALTFCKPALSASICFCWCATVAWKSFCCWARVDFSSVIVVCCYYTLL